MLFSFDILDKNDYFCKRNQKEMLFRISRHIIQLLCVIMILLIQFDVCTPLMDAITNQIEMVENASSEEEASEEVYYRAGKNYQIKAKCLIMDVLAFIKSTSIPSVPTQGNEPVPKLFGTTVQQHIVYCVYRI